MTNIMTIMNVEVIGMTVIDMIAEEDMINILMIEIDIVVDHLMIMIILLIMEGKKKKNIHRIKSIFYFKMYL